MSAEIFSIIAPVFLCALVGYGWAKKGTPFETAFVTRLVTNIGFPCLIFTALIKAPITAETLGTMGLASLLSVAAFAAIAMPVLKLAGLSQRTYLSSMIFTNTGNMGLPLCLLAFGKEGLALAIAYFAVNSILVFVLGPALAAGTANPKEILKIPLVWAVLAALAVKFSGIEIFDWLFKTLDLLGGFAIPLMLVTLGVSLAGLKIASLHRAVWLSVFRLVLGFGVGWGLAEAFGFEGAARGVLIIECALPVAVFNFLFAQAHDNRPDEVASIVLVSTALSFMTLPALLSFLI